MMYSLGGSVCEEDLECTAERGLRNAAAVTLQGTRRVLDPASKGAAK